MPIYTEPDSRTREVCERLPDDTSIIAIYVRTADGWRGRVFNVPDIATTGETLALAREGLQRLWRAWCQVNQRNYDGSRAVGRLRERDPADA